MDLNQDGLLNLGYQLTVCGKKGCIGKRLYMNNVVELFGRRGLDIVIIRGLMFRDLFYYVVMVSSEGKN